MSCSAAAVAATGATAVATGATSAGADSAATTTAAAATIGSAAGGVMAAVFGAAATIAGPAVLVLCQLLASRASLHVVGPAAHDPAVKLPAGLALLHMRLYTLMLSQKEEPENILAEGQSGGQVVRLSAHPPQQAGCMLTSRMVNMAGCGGFGSVRSATRTSCQLARSLPAWLVLTDQVRSLASLCPCCVSHQLDMLRVLCSFSLAPEVAFWLAKARATVKAQVRARVTAWQMGWERATEMSPDHRRYAGGHKGVLYWLPTDPLSSGQSWQLTRQEESGGVTPGGQVISSEQSEFLEAAETASQMEAVAPGPESPEKSGDVAEKSSGAGAVVPREAVQQHARCRQQDYPPNSGGPAPRP